MKNDITIAIISPGNMGAAIGARLSANGIRVVTPNGRSAASQQRALDAGMELVDEQDIAKTDFVFAIVPPGEAVALARHVAPILGRSTKRPLYIDWNAISVQRVLEVENIIVSAGGRFADGSIIGLPPAKEGAGPLLYASGAEAAKLALLKDKGVRFEVMDAPIGAASALKMSYAGITKGVVALGAAMLLAAQRAGCSEALINELSTSQPQLLASYRKSIPDMFSKAERWVPELNEISDFVGDDRTESRIYRAMAAFYADLADDWKGQQHEIKTLKDIVSG